MSKMDTSFRNDKPTHWFSALFGGEKFHERGRDSRPQVKRRDKQRERIVLSEYGALSMCENKKVQYIVNQKRETLYWVVGVRY